MRGINLVAAMHLPSKLKIQLIDSVLAKPIPRDGVVRIGAGVEQVDAKILRFLQNGEPWLIVERREADYLICSTWDGNTHSGETRYPIRQFNDDQYTIKHYFGPNTVYFDSLSDYAIGYYLRIPYTLIHIRRALEHAGTLLYNRRKLVLGQRIELLTFMIEQAADGKASFNSLDLMTHMHTLRWITHPSGDSARSRLELYLDSLVDTGELTKSNSDYRLTGHALRLVEDRAEQEKKHSQSFWIQLLIAALTLTTVILAVFQSGLVKLNPLLDLTQ